MYKKEGKLGRGERLEDCSNEIRKRKKEMSLGTSGKTEE